MEKKRRWLRFQDPSWALLGIFFLVFILLTPLDAFERWIPASFHKGFYSIVRIDPADDTNWYSFLRSTYHDKDINFSNEVWIDQDPNEKPVRGGFYYANFLTPTGYSFALTYGLGASLLWSPFLVVGDYLANFYESLSLSVSKVPETLKGYRYPEMILLGIGSGFYVFLGLLLALRIYQRQFSPITALLATLAIFLASELPYYAFVRNRMLHGLEFFAMALAMTFWEKIYRHEDDLLDRVYLALSFGLLLLVRLNAALYFTIPLGLFAWQCLEHRKDKSSLHQNIGGTALLIAGILVSLLPMFLVTHILYGEAFNFHASTDYIMASGANLFSQQADPTAQSSSVGLMRIPLTILQSFHPLKALFSRQFGFLWFSPIYLLGGLGLLGLVKHEPKRGMLYILGILPSFMWFSGWVGNEYGHRYLLPTLFFIGYGVAALIDRLSKRFGRRKTLCCIGSLLALFSLWNYLILIQYKIVMPYNDPELAWKAFRNLRFWTQIPFFRSTTLPGILFVLRKFQLQSHLDWLFLIMTPVMALLIFIGGFYLVRLLVKPKSLRLRAGLAAAWTAILLSVCLLIQVENPPYRPQEKLNRFLTVGREWVASWPGSPWRHRSGLRNLKMALDLKPEDPQLRALALSGTLLLAKRYEEAQNHSEALWFYRQAKPLLANDPEKLAAYNIHLTELEEKTRLAQ